MAARFSAPFSWCNRVAEQYAVHGRQPGFLHPFRGATELRKQYAVAGLGDFAVCGRRERSAPPRRGGQKDRQPPVFYPLGTPTFPCLLVRRIPETGDRSECFGYGSRVTLAFVSQNVRSSQIAYCYTYGLVCAGATYPCRATRESGDDRQHLRIKVSSIIYPRRCRPQSPD